MRRALRTVIFVALALLAVTATASAAPPASVSVAANTRTSATPWGLSAQNPEVGSALVRLPSMQSRPSGFALDAAQAMKVAETSPVLLAVHRHEHPLRVQPYLWRSGRFYWYITFAYHGQIVGLANVSAAGKLMGAWTGAQAIAPYTHGGYAPPFDKWWVLIPFSVAFLLPFLDLRRWRRSLHLDGLVLLSFMVSYLLFDNGIFDPSVWLVYPPLLYLLGRMLWLGTRSQRTRDRLAPLLPTGVLVAGLLALVGARIALALLGHQEMDVGTASVVGAHRIAHGLPLYFNDPGHGDTYGPFNYLAYMPFQALLPWTSGAAHPWAADAGAVAWDLLTVVALIVLGRKLRPGRSGTRLGLVMAWLWSACPITLLAVVVHTNDGLIALLSVLSLLVFASPVGRGAMLGLAAAAKFSPVALLPLFASPRLGGWKRSIVCGASCLGLTAATILLYLPPGGLSYFYQRTIGFQITRPDVFSPWALHPGLKPVQTVVEGLAIVLILAAPFLLRGRSLTRVCALAAAVTIAVQLPAVHWFYFYILWFLPFVLVALLARTPVAESAAPLDSVPTTEPEAPPLEALPQVLVGA